MPLGRLCGNIDLAETLSYGIGKWMRHITKGRVEFEDCKWVDLYIPDWKLTKPLICCL